jgi:O-antigen/teichoic acid export membrane protein
MAPSTADSAALAKGGRTNFAGFLLRLGARLPFLVLAARLYGAEELGRFAYATMVVELAAALAVLGLKRGLALEMARDAGNRPPAHTIADCLLLALGMAMVATALLVAFPALAFPDGPRPGEWMLFLIVPAVVVSDVTLAALAFRHRIGAAVRARSVVEPWVLTLAAAGLAFLAPSGGLLIAYALSLVAAAGFSLVPAAREYGWPVGWRPSAGRSARRARRLLPIAGADLVDWVSRRLDIFLLGRFATPEIVGIYYVAQQVASLAGKIRVSFDPILAPMLSTALAAGDRARAAAHIRQVGFWVLAFQFPVVLALGLPGEGVMGLFGPAFAGGAAMMALLLTAELAGANASVPEMALVYIRPRISLAIGVGGLALQTLLSLLLIPRFGGEGAAAALLVALVAVGLARQTLLHRELAAPVACWRWSLLLAAIPAFALGYAARALPELPQMVIAIPGILILFGAIVWRVGFGPADRLLFRGRGGAG